MCGCVSRARKAAGGALGGNVSALSGELSVQHHMRLIDSVPNIVLHPELQPAFPPRMQHAFLPRGLGGAGEPVTLGLSFSAAARAPLPSCLDWNLPVPPRFSPAYWAARSGGGACADGKGMGRICDRLFVGGPTTLRGFEPCGIGPRAPRRAIDSAPPRGTARATDALGGDFKCAAGVGCPLGDA